MSSSGAVFASMLLADGRFPVGGHVHSAGVEAAVADGRITDIGSLDAFVLGRLSTVGLTDAALSAATVVWVSRVPAAPGAPESCSARGSHDATDSSLHGAAGDRQGGVPANGDQPDDVSALLRRLDAEAGARIAVPVLRDTSRKLGRQLIRVAGRCWPSPLLAVLAGEWPGGIHQAVAVGAVGVACALGPTDVAQLSLHHAITTPAQAAVRLLGLDPFAVAALTARLAGPAQLVVAAAVTAAHGPLADLPARAGPLLDIAACEHRDRDLRLFAT